MLTELFPTPIRNTAVALGGFFGGIGAILGFLMEALEIVWKPLPSIVIASTFIVAVILVPFLPETKGRKLPETLEDAFKTVRQNEHDTKFDNLAFELEKSDINNLERSDISHQLLYEKQRDKVDFAKDQDVSTIGP